MMLIYQKTKAWGILALQKSQDIPLSQKFSSAFHNINFHKHCVAAAQALTALTGMYLF